MPQIIWAQADNTALPSENIFGNRHSALVGASTLTVVEEVVSACGLCSCCNFRFPAKTLEIRIVLTPCLATTDLLQLPRAVLLLLWRLRSSRLSLRFLHVVLGRRGRLLRLPSALRSKQAHVPGPSASSVLICASAGTSVDPSLRQ